ncbi:uncharacterized protein LOC125646152 [Ostrea edulis]|uniref:uncharacterized protein LOC125646152 n=1 Tax=Ostrea edulis TaxID=37623 RepID=UPI0024AFC97B|nr:uncharacterized protein LOC125646152 [Ostrea edulis]
MVKWNKDHVFHSSRLQIFFYLVDKTTSRSNITYMRDYLIDCFSSPQHKHLLQFYKTDEIAMALNTLYDKRNKKNFTEVVFRGVPYADFDPSGHWSTWSLIRMFEGSLILSASMSPVLVKTTTSHEEDYILLRQHCKVSPRYYQDITIYSDFNPKILFRCQEVGRTSLSTKLKLYNLSSEHVYATNLRKLVNFNSRTKKPVPNNPYYLEQAERINDTKPKHAWLPFPDKVPSRVFSMQMSPLFSDTDFMNHVNNSSYVRFCLDCFAYAAKSNFYSHFEADCCYPVLEIDIQYLDESYANDTLQITTWQSETDIGDLFFIISREHKVIVKTFLRFGVTKLDKTSFIYSKM